MICGGRGGMVSTYCLAAIEKGADMHSAISATLGAIHFADPQFVGGLTVLPIIVDAPEHVDILSLSQAHESGAVTIRELQGHASVPELEVINAGNLPVLILDGEQVRGGWQDRAAAVSCLLGPRSELRLPVSCVEHGRWGSGPAEFCASQDHLPPSHRAMRQEQVRAAVQHGDRRGAGQGAVWESIAAAQASAGVASRTGALRDLYEGLEDRIARGTASTRSVDGQRGFLALYGDHPVCLELLGPAASYERAHRRLIRALLADIVNREPLAAAGEPFVVAHAFLEHARHCQETVVPGVGLGQEHYLKNDNVAGFALTHEAALLHLSLFGAADSMEPHGRNLPVPHPRSYWVEPGRFIAGSYPGDLGKREAEAKLAALLDAGVRSFMNLMEPDEVDSSGNLFRPYEALCRQLAQSRGIEVAFHRMPIHDESIPTPDHMARILDVIDAEMRRGVVYVHCWGGRGRTGTVVGCWLARHGRAVGDEALRRIQHLRRHEETASKPSPQTECQREMVRRWREGI